MGKKIIAVSGFQGFIGSAILKHSTNADVHIESMSNTGGAINIHDISELCKYFQQRRPDAIIHLAAQSNIPLSFEDPNETYRDNFLGVSTILKALEASNIKPKFIFASTAHVYGHLSGKDLPVKEHHPLRPLSPYGLSKQCSEELLAMQGRLQNLKSVIVRPFNISGAGQSEKFVLSALAKQVVEVSLGQKASIEVGNLNIFRDFLDVHDAAAAFIKLSVQDHCSGTYNLCSGTPYQLSALLAEMTQLCGVAAPIITDSSRFRSSDQPILVGCNEKLKKETGWMCHIPIEQTLIELMNYWRNKLCQKSAL